MFSFHFPTVFSISISSLLDWCHPSSLVDCCVSLSSTSLASPVTSLSRRSISVALTAASGESNNRPNGLIAAANKFNIHKPSYDGILWIVFYRKKNQLNGHFWSVCCVFVLYSSGRWSVTNMASTPLETMWVTQTSSLRGSAFTTTKLPVSQNELSKTLDRNLPVQELTHCW